jgi:hypothetical protein
MLNMNAGATSRVAEWAIYRSAQTISALFMALVDITFSERQ